MVNRGKGSQQGKSQLIALVVVALVLAAGYYVLDRYSAGQKDMAVVETRGLQMISALTKFRQEAGRYPESLDKLVPKYVAATGKCPGGEAMAYEPAGGEYALSCANVVFKLKPYRYDSRTRNWAG